jgi:glycosylphosphatidylinositol transamidase (GPIT) subunit GPI8
MTKANSKSRKKQYHLSFVNNDKPFTLSKWTVKKHKELLKETAKYEKTMTQKELDEKSQNILILMGLHEIDPNVTEEDLETLHPGELMDLFRAVYYQGREGIEVQEDFRQTKKNLSKK